MTERQNPPQRRVPPIIDKTGAGEATRPAETSESEPTGKPTSLDSNANPLESPANLLILLSILFLIISLASLPLRMDKMVFDRPQDRSAIVTGMLLGTATTVGFQFTIIAGALNMRRLRGYRLAFAATVMSVIPFCTPWLILGIPIGVWAMALLLRPEVKARFT